MKSNEKNENIEMLNELYQNADMGERGTELLIERTKDANLSAQLNQYAERYAMIKKDASALLSQQGQTPKFARQSTRAGLWMGVNMNTMIDKTPSHIAEMLIQGSTMGIIKGEKNKKKNPNTDTEVKTIEDNLIKLEQDYINTMKQFL